jgi:hypothetical protein
MNERLDMQRAKSDAVKWLMAAGLLGYEPGLAGGVQASPLNVPPFSSSSSI